MIVEIDEDLFKGLLVNLPEDAKNPTVIYSHNYFKSPRIEHSTGGIDLILNGKFVTNKYEVKGLIGKALPVEKAFELLAKYKLPLGKGVWWVLIKID